MKKLFPYFKPYKKQSLLGPLFKLLEATFELIVPVIVALIVDKGLGERALTGGYPNADKPYIIRMSLVLGGFALIGFVCAVIAQYFAARAATGVSADLRKALFSRLQSLSYADIDSLGTSAMLTRLTSDVDQFQSGVNMALRLFLRSPFIVFGALVAAFFIDPVSSSVFAVVIAVLTAVVFTILLSSMRLYKKSQEKLDKVFLSARENLTGVRVIRAFCKEEEESRIFEKRNQELTKSRNLAGLVGALMNPLTYAILNLAVIALLYVGAVRVDGGLLSQGKVLALYNLMSQILVELIKLANLIVTVSKAAASGSRIESALALENTLEHLPPQTKDPSAPFLKFDRVDMRYPGGGEYALKDIDFTLNRGETLGVIGGTGSGKTTLVNVAAHFYDVTNGSVKIEGADVRSIPDSVLRKRFGIVPQKAALFQGTIRDNLLWGNPNAADEELMDAARIAQADKIIEEKGGLGAVVEQGGRNFSGGQKQRLTIARALVGKPEILVLDDSSSALDYATDAALRKGLKTLSYRPTVFVVSQRTSAIRGADKILVLDEGAAVGLGTHDELLKTCEVYKEIYDSQYRGGEAAV